MEIFGSTTASFKEIMPRVRIIKLFKGYNVGDIVDVSPNIAHGLIDAGVAVISKDMVSEIDYGTKTLKKAKNKARRRNG